MNLFDMRTVVLTSAAIVFVCSLLLLMLWRQNRGRFSGMGLWAGGFAAVAVGFCLLFLRGIIPNAASILLANVVIMSGALMTLVGTDRFLGRRGGHLHNVVLLGVFAVLFARYSLVQDHLPARTALVSVLMTLFTAQGAWRLLVSIGPEVRRWTFLTGSVYGAFALINIVRLVRITSGADASWGDFFAANGFETLIVFLYQLLSILLTYSLTLMVTRRLLLDVRAQEEKFSRAFRSAPYVLTLARLSDGLIREVNEGFVGITGYAYDEAVGRTFSELGLWAVESDRRAVVEALVKTGSVRDREYPFRLRSGETMLGALSSDTLEIGGETCVLSSITDVTDRRRMEDALRESEEKFRYMAEHSSDTIWHTDAECRFTYVSPADERMRGFTQDEVVGTTVWSLLKPEGVEHVRRLSAQYAAEGRTDAGTGALRYELELICKDGTWLWTEVNVVPHRDGVGKLVGYHGVTRDISERKRTAERMEHLARHDPLTDLPNRALFFDRLDVALALSKRNGTRLALMFVDLDRFKPVNDTFGHAVGDVLLREAAGRMRACIRGSDTVGRIGGDEFVVLLPAVETQKAPLVVAEKLRRALARPFEIDGRRIGISCSIGIAIAPDDGCDPIELAKNADMAMYLAKQQGGDAVRFFGSQAEAPRVTEKALPRET
ncbi:diguanylate cyclase with PAS/PAC sensor [Aminomonas paucivorans DSM 12260]|uniref:Diguanylate cyclase with PAS/PAC sensor n=1 Tax=Aminomonas paucivorans DSM 12260 TaxID=584708 RepID=E3CZ52_9BACT|nr:diguanylate cyclase [Aminomonas paucivorans]EFQ22825.1 diguanylate cyclase with PAS/PAC sensor [Aminomonas paucivorans DSM 12260]